MDTATGCTGDAGLGASTALTHPTDRILAVPPTPRRVPGIPPAGGRAVQPEEREDGLFLLP